LTLSKAVGFKSARGKGAEALIDGRQVVVGTRALLASREIGVEDVPLATVFVAVEGGAVGALTVSDPIRKESAAVIDSLHRMGLRTVMVSGDNRETAEAVAAQIGIETVEAEVLPQDKSALIERYQRKGDRVAMVGDGLNDGPALAQADLGIAMGSGTDVAIESAGITLLHADLTGVAIAIRLARATLSTIRWNLAWAFGYNIVMIPLAMTGRLNPMLAAGAMTFSSLSVVANSLRLRRFAPASTRP
jgi:Cu+-exporting ATPase